MEMILGIIALIIICFVLDNIGMVLAAAAGIAIIILLIRMARKNRKKAETASSATKENDGTYICEKCQHCDLGKAKKEGYSSSHCYCRAEESIVLMRKDCAKCKRRGCANSLCDYADFTSAKSAGKGEKCCYCNYYNKYMESRDSCEGYTDDATTALIKSLLK